MTPPRFDWLAPHYAWVEAATYGGLLHWCRTALVGELAGARRVLILGEGDGRFASAFLAANRDAVVDVVDASAAMVALAKRRVARASGAADRVRWHVADARRFDPPAAPYDLVVTNFFLDCFRAPDLALLVPRLTAALVPGGRWLVGDFARPAGGVERLAAHAALAAMYAAFFLTTRIPAYRLTDPSPLMHAEGMELVREERRLRGFLAAQLWRKAVTDHPAAGADASHPSTLLRRSVGPVRRPSDRRSVPCPGIPHGLFTRPSIVLRTPR